MIIKIKDPRALAVESASRGHHSVEEYINKTLWLPSGMIKIEYKEPLNAIDIECLLATGENGMFVVLKHFSLDDARYYLKDIDYLLDWDAKYLEASKN